MQKKALVEKANCESGNPVKKGEPAPSREIKWCWLAGWAAFVVSGQRQRPSRSRSRSLPGLATRQPPRSERTRSTGRERRRRPRSRRISARSSSALALGAADGHLGAILGGAEGGGRGSCCCGYLERGVVAREAVWKRKRERQSLDSVV